MKKWAVVSMALLGCGGPSATAPSPTTAASAPPAASVAAPAPAPFDPALPKEAVWLATLEGRSLTDLLADPAAMAMGKSSLGGVDLSVLSELGIDPARPVYVAQIGMSDMQRSAFEALLAAEPNVEALAKMGREHPLGIAFRVVLPVTDPARARAAAARTLGSFGLPADGNAFGADDLRVELTAAARELVIDVAIAKQPKKNLADLREAVKRGHADPPAATASVHATYRPSDLAALSAYSEMMMMSAAIGGDTVDPPTKKRIVAGFAEEAKTMLTLHGSREKAAIDQVELLGRREAAGLTFELRSTVGKASLAPPAEAWKPAPSFAPDGPEGYVSFSRPFVSAWKLAGDPADAPLTLSPAAQTTPRGFLSMAASLGILIPVFSRLSARVSHFPEAAFAKIERAGNVLPTDGTRMDVGLLDKKVTATDAACLLATSPKCTERLKLGAAAIEMPDKRFARLIPVKGTTALALVLADTKASADALKLHATTAPPLEGILPRHMGNAETGIDIPWLAPTQRLTLESHLDGNVIVLEAAPTP